MGESAILKDGCRVRLPFPHPSANVPPDILPYAATAATSTQGSTTVAFVMGFAVWIALGLLGGFVMYFSCRGPETTQLMTLVLSVFGAFIGGMLGMSGYIHNAPLPLRVGGLIGATLGAF